MKVKVKLDLASVKTWFFEHGEKLAFGLMALVFLMFVYSATRREVLDATKQPDKLTEVASQVTRYVADSQWDEKTAGVEVVDYSQRAKRDPVPLAAFAINVVLDNPIFDPKGKRDDPEMFAVEELRVQGGFGSFALSGGKKADNRAGPGKAGGGGQGGQGGGAVRPSADATLAARAWVVVTGLVPHAKQSAEYTRVFSRAMGEKPGGDAPQYVGAVVERAEVDPSNPEKLDWKPIKPAADFEKQWEARADEIVAATYCDASFTGPLGPLVDAAWDASVAHPKIPTIKMTEAAGLPAEARPAEAAAARAAAADRQNPAAAPSTTSDYKLLRVFDYEVEPNRSYRYRVKLKLENPNYRVDRKFLAKPAAPSNDQEFVETANWSGPSDVVAVPSGYGVLAGSVEAKGPEPAANLLLLAIDQKDGIPAATKAKLYRGNVANKKESKVRATDPRGAQKVVEIDDVDFNTSIVVVDIFGGKPISLRSRRESPLSAPGEVLLLDAQGNLVVHNELDDHAQYERRQPPEEEEVTRPESTPDDSKAKRSPRAKAKS